MGFKQCVKSVLEPMANSIKSQLKCSICGEDRIWCLDFHHTNPSEKEGSVSHMIQAPNKLKSELEKCIVLCANCHRDVHYQMNKANLYSFDSEHLYDN